MSKLFTKTLLASALSSMALAAALPTFASSHREAPLITETPKVDGTDFYMFRSYESGRAGYVTFLANYLPLQDAYGGPNYFDLKDAALYQIHVDQNGDGQEDLTYSFEFQTIVNDLTVPVNGTQVSVPLKNIGGIGPNAEDVGSVNVRQTFSVGVITGDRRTGSALAATNTTDSSTTFAKPLDNIGNKSIADYATYANNHIHPITIPGCDTAGRVFVGQRQDGFAVNLGAVFDLVNLNPLAAPDSVANTIADKNVTTIALEIPIACVTNGSESVIGAWTTASMRQARVINPTPDFDMNKASVVEGGPWVQVSRLGMPLVNELVIGLKDKDLFNTSEPSDDGQFIDYVTNPTLPELLEILFAGVAVAPNLFPRTDLVTAFLTGVEGLNQPANIEPSEMLRLNTSTPPVAQDAQENLGVLAGDVAGFPNGRRPGDDVVDITLRVAMGALIADATVAPNNTAPLTDGVSVDATQFPAAFPYLNTALPGAGNE